MSMAEEIKPTDESQGAATLAQAPTPDYDEFEVGEHKVPWFLWIFFILIVSWASISWIQFFGY
jgi:hypothetical protein